MAVDQGLLLDEAAELGKELKVVQAKRRTCKANWMKVAAELDSFGKQIRAIMDKQVVVNKSLGLVKGRV